MTFIKVYTHEISPHQAHIDSSDLNSVIKTMLLCFGVLFTIESIVQFYVDAFVHMCHQLQPSKFSGTNDFPSDSPPAKMASQQ